MNVNNPEQGSGAVLGVTENQTASGIEFNLPVCLISKKTTNHK
jgi:hypothetical protein